MNISTSYHIPVPHRDYNHQSFSFSFPTPIAGNLVESLTKTYTNVLTSAHALERRTFTKQNVLPPQYRPKRILYPNIHKCIKNLTKHKSKDTLANTDVLRSPTPRKSYT